VGMILSFTVSIVTALATKAPPQEVQDMVEEIRIPSAKAHVSHGPAE
jgi:cation/acetate symporter